MATFNLVRNSRVFYTTNVNSNGKVGRNDADSADVACTSANTQELQVLDGFTFGQTSNADTITISEAGATPTRGQRSFNTSLGQADFSFSTYLRPFKATTVQCEESVLWNSLLGSVAIGASNAIALDMSGASSTPSLVAYASSVLSITNTSTGDLVAGEVVMVTGHVAADHNTAIKIVSVISNTSFTATWIAAPAATSTTGADWENVKLVRTAWNAQGTTYAEVTSALSNKNQLVKFGMIMVVDGISYVIDNCCMNQAVIDFGLDGIAMAAWTGMGTTLRQLSTQAVFTLPSNVATSLSVGTTITGGLAS